MRPLAWLAVVVLAIAWLALPPTDAAALAVQRVPRLFQAPIADTGTSLADRVLDAAAREEPSSLGGPATLRLDLGGVRLTVPGVGSDDLTIHGRARRAVIAALRQAAAERQAVLAVRGELSAERGGVSVLLTAKNQGLAAILRIPGVGDAAASIPSPPSDKRALLPALVAIALVLLWRRPLVALFLGLGLGAGLVHAATRAADPQLAHEFPGAFVRLVYEELVATEAWKPLATMLALLATWAITARNGGLGGVTAWLSPHMASARRAQLSAWLCSLSLFVDPPQKNAVLGWMLRSNMVRARVSTEKLAWFLDTVGTAVLGLCILSPFTAMAFQFAAAQSGGTNSASELWLATLPWRGFCWMSLGLALCVAQSGRDFGPMLSAERRAREGLGVQAREARRIFAAPEPDPRTALHAWRALAPLAAYVLALWAQGVRAALDSGLEFHGSRIGDWFLLTLAVDGLDAPLIASLAALLVALALSAVGGAERGVPAAVLHGVRAAVRPCLLLFAAWALAFVTARLGGGEVLAAVLGDRVAPQTLPAILFLIAAGMGFAFGSPWLGLPWLLPLAAGLSRAFGADFGAGESELLVLSLAATLEGSLAGALLSPLSYSSLSASIGAGADHRDHVRTQAPYALLTLVAVLVFGFLPAGLFGIGPWLALALGVAVHAAVFAWLSRACERRAA